MRTSTIFKYLRWLQSRHMKVDIIFLSFLIKFFKSSAIFPLNEQKRQQSKYVIFSIVYIWFLENILYDYGQTDDFFMSMLELCKLHGEGDFYRLTNNYSWRPFYLN